MNNFKLSIEDFSGPLDLLLHLIKESKMNIYDLKINEITKQYIDFINHMEKLNIDVASEYLVMASTLIHLKSKMLINEKDEEETVNDEEITTEEELKRRLIEYNQYKELTNSFKILENKRQEVYTKVPESLNEFRENIKLNTDTTLDDLLNAFEEFLKRQKYLKPLDTKVTEIRSCKQTVRSSDIFIDIGNG